MGKVKTFINTKLWWEKKKYTSISENKVKFAEVEANGETFKPGDIGVREPGYKAVFLAQESWDLWQVLQYL